MPEQTDVLAVIAEITAEEAGVEASTITPESRFADDLDIDSLGLLTIATRSRSASASRWTTPSSPPCRPLARSSSS